jgi:hypothetical protein
VKRKSGRQVGAAVQTCIDLFYVTRSAQIAVTKTLGALRRIGWQPADISRVERVVRCALAITPDVEAACKAA